MKEKSGHPPDKNNNSLAAGNKKKLELMLKYLQEELEISEDKIKEIEKIASVIEISKISSPYPPPELLEHYEEVYPGFIGKIIEYIDINQEQRIKERQHHMEVEKLDIGVAEKFLEYNYSNTKRGQWQAFIIALFGLAGGVICAFLKLEVLGAAFVGFPLASIISNFLVNKNPKKEHRAPKE